MVSFEHLRDRADHLGVAAGMGEQRMRADPFAAHRGNHCRDARVKRFKHLDLDPGAKPQRRGGKIQRGKYRRGIVHEPRHMHMVRGKRPDRVSGMRADDPEMRLWVMLANFGQQIAGHMGHRIDILMPRHIAPEADTAGDDRVWPAQFGAGGNSAAHRLRAHRGRRRNGADFFGILRGKGDDFSHMRPYALFPTPRPPGFDPIGQPLQAAPLIGASFVKPGDNIGLPDSEQAKAPGRDGRRALGAFGMKISDFRVGKLGLDYWPQRVAPGRYERREQRIAEHGQKACAPGDRHWRQQLDIRRPFFLRRIERIEFVDEINQPDLAIFPGLLDQPLVEQLLRRGCCVFIGREAAYRKHNALVIGQGRAVLSRPRGLRACGLGPGRIGRFCRLAHVVLVAAVLLGIIARVAHQLGGIIGATKVMQAQNIRQGFGSVEDWLEAILEAVSRQAALPVQVEAGEIFLCIAIIARRSAGGAAPVIEGFQRTDHIVVQAGERSFANIFRQADRVVLRHVELGHSIACRIAPDQIRGAPATERLRGGMIVHARIAARIADHGFEPSRAWMIGRRSAAKLLMHLSVMVFLPAAIAENPPWESNPGGLFGKFREQFLNCVGLVRHEKFINIADQGPVAAEKLCIVLQNPIAGSLWRLTRFGLMSDVAQPAMGLQRIQQRRGAICAIIRHDSDIKAEHTIPTDPFQQERAFISGHGQGGDFTVFGHVRFGIALFVPVYATKGGKGMVLSENTRGALLMIGAMTAYALNDACVKGLVGELPFFQAMFLRGLGTTILLAALVAAMGQLVWPAPGPDRRWVIWRGLAELAASFLFLAALYNMPLTNAVAIMQVLPLSIPLAAWLFLGEPLGWRRMAAIGIGFLGVMLILRPGGEGFNIYGLAALGAVLAVTVRDLAARKLSAETSSMMVALVASVIVTAGFALGAALTPWEPVAPRAAVLIGGAVALILVGYVLSVAVMRVGDVAVIAPFRYTSLVIAMLVGVVVFDERPDGLTLLGALIVVASGLFALWRARQLARRA